MEAELESFIGRKLSHCEIVRITGARSRKLLQGELAWVLIGDETDSLMIAKMELAAKKMPIEFFDEATQTYLDPNPLVTDETVEYLRLNYLNDWPDRKMELMEHFT